MNDSWYYGISNDFAVKLDIILSSLARESKLNNRDAQALNVLLKRNSFKEVSFVQFKSIVAFPIVELLHLLWFLEDCELIKQYQTDNDTMISITNRGRRVWIGGGVESVVRAHNELHESMITTNTRTTNILGITVFISSLSLLVSVLTFLKNDTHTLHLLPREVSISPKLYHQSSKCPEIRHYCAHGLDTSCCKDTQNN